MRFMKENLTIILPLMVLIGLLGFIWFAADREGRLLMERNAWQIENSGFTLVYHYDHTASLVKDPSGSLWDLTFDLNGMIVSKTPKIDSRN